MNGYQEVFQFYTESTRLLSHLIFVLLRELIHLQPTYWQEFAAADSVSNSIFSQLSIKNCSLQSEILWIQYSQKPALSCCIRKDVQYFEKWSIVERCEDYWRPNPESLHKAISKATAIRHPALFVPCCINPAPG